MATFEGEYSGAALAGFLENFEPSPALVEHGASGCVDTGDDACIYRVSW